MLFSNSLLPDAFARAFLALPTVPLWQWADENVWLENKATSEAGPYRSARTPWNRRLQELIQRPRMWCYDFRAAEWREFTVKEINEMKCSQGGVSEACLNGIRYKANYRPENVIYTVDTRETARDISERLEPSLRKLDGNIFTGDDDDVGTFTMRLRAMDIWFQGSFSTGKFASKQAPFVIADEVEEHGTESKDTSTITNLRSRKKCADNGLQINLCKPKLTGGPIHKAFLRGNQELFHICCPHCRQWQPLTFFRNEESAHPRLTPFSEKLAEIRDEQTGRLVALLPDPLPLGETRKVRTGRLVFEHCRDLLGRWDKLAILRETYYECSHCLGKIEEHHKPALIDSAQWIPTAIGTPGVVSQQVNELYSTDANSTWGQIVLAYLDAKREGRRELQGFYNHQLGEPWRDEAHHTDAEAIKANIAGRTVFYLDTADDRGQPRRDVFDSETAAETARERLAARGVIVPITRSHCAPYRRGTVPFVTYPAQKWSSLILGSDVGGNYARWVVASVAPNLQDVAIVDWGDELDPAGIGGIMLSSKWPLAGEAGKFVAPQQGFLDAKYRRLECWQACLAVPGQKLIPCAGGASARGTNLFAYHQIPEYPKKLKRLTIFDAEAKDELYVECIRKKRRRVWFPIDVAEDPRFIAELTAEQKTESESGKMAWDPNPKPNHFGDCVKLLVIGLRFLTMRQAGTAVEPAR